jgi:hypothetical protein
MIKYKFIFKNTKIISEVILRRYVENNNIQFNIDEEKLINIMKNH